MLFNFNKKHQKKVERTTDFCPEPSAEVSSFPSVKKDCTLYTLVEDLRGRSGKLPPQDPVVVPQAQPV